MTKRRKPPSPWWLNAILVVGCIGIAAVYLWSQGVFA